MNKTVITMDTLCRYRNGAEARILCVDANGDYPIVSLAKDGACRTHTKEGTIHKPDSAWGQSHYDLMPIGKYNYETDDKVLVSNDNVVWFNRHFSHEKNGIAYTFECGRTSWSNTISSVSEWKFCKKASE